MHSPLSRHQRIRHRIRQALALTLASASVAGCDVATRDPLEDQFSPSGLSAYNYTSEGIQEFFVDGAWGSNVGGGVVCCVSLPKKWQPGLSVTLEWRRSDCGMPESPECTLENVGAWPEKQFKRIIPVEAYQSADDLQVMFLPNDEIKIYAAGMSPSHPEHPSRLGRARPLSAVDVSRILGK